MAQGSFKIYFYLNKIWINNQVWQICYVVFHVQMFINFYKIMQKYIIIKICITYWHKQLLDFFFVNVVLTSKIVQFLQLFLKSLFILFIRCTVVNQFFYRLLRIFASLFSIPFSCSLLFLFNLLLTRFIN